MKKYNKLLSDLCIWVMAICFITAITYIIINIFITFIPIIAIGFLILFIVYLVGILKGKSKK